MKNILLLIVLASCLCQCKAPATLAQADNRPNEPGKCYAKCQIRLITHTETYFEYDGDIAPEDLDVAYKTIETSPARSEWVKKKADRPCHSSNPDDCLVWCLVEVPAQTQKIAIVKDTSQTKQWKVRTINYYGNGAPQVDWREVVCADKLDRLRISLIQDKLDEKGYYTGMTRGDYQNPKLHSALKSYQSDNNLPIGNYDIETIKSLGIDF